MAELNFTSLLCDDQIINIKTPTQTKQIKFKKLSAIRTWSILEKYNKIIIPVAIGAKKNKDEKKTEEEKLLETLCGDMKKTKKTTLQLIDLCLEIIRPVGFWNKLKMVVSRQWVSRKWILSNFDADEVSQFLQLVLKPLTGEKKTAVEKQ